MPGRRAGGEPEQLTKESIVTHVSPVEYPYRWRWSVRLPERHGQPCRITARGTLNSVPVEFPDGFWVVTSRWAVRRAR
jgi:hypothetical protein